MSERKPQTEDKYIVRFPKGMRDILKESAEKAGRSLNAEIIFRLQHSLRFDYSSPVSVDVMDAAIQETVRRMKFILENPTLAMLESGEEFERRHLQQIDDERAAKEKRKPTQRS